MKASHYLLIIACWSSLEISENLIAAWEMSVENRVKKLLITDFMFGAMSVFNRPLHCLSPALWILLIMYKSCDHFVEYTLTSLLVVLTVMCA